MNVPRDNLGLSEAPVRPASAGPAVRPRDAASLILLDRSGAEIRVLMGRRHGGHDFMPDKWVFPGGRLDRSDFRAPSASELSAEVAARLAKTAPAARARAIALAAVRETFEEAGLLLARPAPARRSKRPWGGTWGAFLGQGVHADLSALSFIARAITPPFSPKRFDARFFMADAARLVSLDRQGDCGELDEIAWFTLKEALGLDLPSVTRFVLTEIPHRLADPARPVPSLSFRWAKQRIEKL